MSIITLVLFTDDAPVATTNVEKVFLYACVYYIVHLLYHRQKGMIINVCASIASAPPTPLMTVYQAAMVSINKDKTHLVFYCITCRAMSTVSLKDYTMSVQVEEWWPRLAPTIFDTI